MICWLLLDHLRCVKGRLQYLGYAKIHTKRNTMNAKNPPYEEAAAFLKVLANPNRLAALCQLHESPRNVTELAEAVGLPQAAMSVQLAVLREAGLVSCEVNHRERLYSLADARVAETIKLLYSFFCAEE